VGGGEPRGDRNFSLVKRKKIVVRDAVPVKIWGKGRRGGRKGNSTPGWEGGMYANKSSREECTTEKRGGKGGLSQRYSLGEENKKEVRGGLHEEFYPLFEWLQPESTKKEGKKDWG